MRRIVIPATFAVALALMLGGCASSPPPPVKPPAVDPQTRLVPAEGNEPVPVIAPPPAYGNKIVMARRASAVEL